MKQITRGRRFPDDEALMKAEIGHLARLKVDNLLNALRPMFVLALPVERRA
ncbi:Protein of unknown function, partial [Gryllus bimaculatus]